MDTTYIPMHFVYQSTVLDWVTRRVRAWRLSNRLTADPWVYALEDAIIKYERLKIMNTDKASQFTNSAFVSLHQDAQHSSQHDGKAVGTE